MPQDFFENEADLRLAEAISSFDLGRTRELLDQSPELNRAGRYGFTLLYWAFAEGNIDAFRLLLEHGADPDQKLVEYCPTKGWDVFFEGSCVIFASVKAIRADFGMAALPYSSEPNKLGINGVNILHHYFGTMNSGGSERHLKVMIDQGVSINGQGAYGYTPCHWAVYESPNLCVPLLEAGADPSIRDDRGYDIVDAVESQVHLLDNAKTPTSQFAPVIEWLNENYRKVDVDQASLKAPVEGDQ